MACLVLKALDQSLTEVLNKYDMANGQAQESLKNRISKPVAK